MWCRGRTGVLVILEQCKIIRIEESEWEGKPGIRLIAFLDNTTQITLETADLETMPRDEAMHEVELIREQLFRAISNGARFFRIE